MATLAVDRFLGKDTDANELLINMTIGGIFGGIGAGLGKLGSGPRGVVKSGVGVGDTITYNVGMPKSMPPKSYNALNGIKNRGSLNNIISGCLGSNTNQDKVDRKSRLALLLGGGVKVDAAGVDCSKMINVTNDYKHYPSKNIDWKDIVKITAGNSPAKYKSGLNIPNLEKTAAENGIFDGTYVWYKSNSIVGASKGTETQYIRIDLSAGTYHGHPVTNQEVINMGGNDIFKQLNK